MAARKRKTGESFKAYRRNLRAEGRADTQRCNSGYLRWNSLEHGTYVRAKHGELKTVPLRL